MPAHFAVLILTLLVPVPSGAWGGEQGSRTSVLPCMKFFPATENETRGERWLSQGSYLPWVRGEHGAANDLLARMGSWGSRAIRRSALQSRSVSSVSLGPFSLVLAWHS